MINARPWSPLFFTCGNCNRTVGLTGVTIEYGDDGDTSECLCSECAYKLIKHIKYAFGDFDEY